MISGRKVVQLKPAEAMDRLRMMLAGANCEIREAGEDFVRFRHGTYLTQTPSLLPKEGTVRVSVEGNSTVLEYEIGATGFVKIWFILIGILFCWAIFPPIMTYMTLAYHPRRFMENLLAGV